MAQQIQFSCIFIVALLVLNLLSFVLKPTATATFDTKPPNEFIRNVSSIASHNTTNNDTNGSWIGDYWIPPSATQRFYSAPEMRNLFANHSIVFVGDSTARRVFTTLYYILETPDLELLKLRMSLSHVIDVNRKGKRQEPCRSNPNLKLCRKHPQNPDLRADYVERKCNYGVSRFFRTFDLSAYTLVVVAYGGWHHAQKCFDSREEKLLLRDGGGLAAEQTIEAMKQVQRHNLTIVWRSIGMPRLVSPEVVNQTRNLNRFFMEHIHQHEEEYWNQTGQLSSLTALDWGYVMEPRTIPLQDRIDGDITFHFGFEARLVLLQMLVHHLVVRSSRTGIRR